MALRGATPGRHGCPSTFRIRLAYPTRERANTRFELYSLDITSAR